MNRGIVVGINKYGKKVYLSNDRPNDHLAISGASGYGKTSFIDALLLQLIILCARINVLRFAWHSCTQKDQRLPAITAELDRNTFIINAKDELPMKLFDSERRCKLSEREQCIEIDRIANVLASAAKLPVTQHAAVIAAVKEVYLSDYDTYKSFGLRAVGENLLDLGKTAINAYTKLHTVFEGANIRSGEIEFKKPICEVDINAFDNVSQRIISNLTMSYYYEKAKSNEFLEDGFAIVLDEAQNADLRDAQIVSEMLMESRKKNMRMIMATPQPLIDTSEYAAMYQCGTKIFFKPAGYEDKLAKIIDPRHVDDMTLMLKRLRRGEFVAVGSFVTEEGVLSDRPVKLRTYIPEYARSDAPVVMDSKMTK